MQFIHLPFSWFSHPSTTIFTHIFSTSLFSSILICPYHLKIFPLTALYTFLHCINLFLFLILGILLTPIIPLKLFIFISLILYFFSFHTNDSSNHAYSKLKSFVYYHPHCTLFFPTFYNFAFI